MSELIDTVKDTFKGGGNKKKIILFGVLGAAVVGLALYARSKGGASGSGDSAGIGDDTSGSGGAPTEADLSGLIDGFGSEIDRLDARIANLGAAGQGYTTLDGSGGVTVPNTDNMAAYSPVAEEITVSTSPSPEPALDSSRLAAENGYNAILPVVNRVVAAPVAAPVAVKSPVAVAAAPAPSSVKLVIAPKTAPVVTTKLPVSPELAAGMAKDPYLAARINAATAMTPKAAPVKSIVKVVSEGARSFLGGNMAPAPAPKAQPVAAAKPNSGGGAITLNIVRTPAAAPKSMPYSPLNPAPTKTVKLATGKNITVPVNPSRIGG